MQVGVAMRRTLLLLSAVFVLAMVSGCAGNGEGTHDSSDSPQGSASTTSPAKQEFKYNKVERSFIGQPFDRVAETLINDIYPGTETPGISHEDGSSWVTGKSSTLPKNSPTSSYTVVGVWVRVSAGRVTNGYSESGRDIRDSRTSEGGEVSSTNCSGTLW